MGDTLIPLLRDTKDIHYRYKMPKLTAKVEGSGNGIKTVITNMTGVAKALHRPPNYPTKYFGCELGAQVFMNVDHNEFIVNGAHDAEKLLQLLYAFIRKFVLCPKCNNPETDLKVIDKKLHQNCIACGHRTTIPSTMHKLCTYIINHPPNSDDTNGKKTSGKGKDGKEAKKEKKSSKKANSPTSDERKGDDESKNTGNGDDDFDDFEDDDLTSDAYAERMRALMDGFQSVSVTDPVERANLFYKSIGDKKAAGQLGDVNVQKELLNEAERLGIKEKATLLLSEALFTENIIDEVKAYRMVLLRFCAGSQKAQKYLLGGIEKLIGDVHKDKLLAKTANILKAFYDNDILEEEVLIDWSDKVSKKYVGKETAKLLREKAAPLIKWLKEAEVEEDSENEEPKKQQQPANGTNGKGNGKAKYDDDDEEDEDDDIDIEYNYRVSGIQVEDVKAVNSTEHANDGEEDLNIDDI